MGALAFAGTAVVTRLKNADYAGAARSVGNYLSGKWLADSFAKAFKDYAVPDVAAQAAGDIMRTPLYGNLSRDV